VTGVQAPATIVNSKKGPGVITAGQSVNGNFAGGTAVEVANPTYTGTSPFAGSYLSCPVATSNFELWVTLPTAAPAQETTLASQWATDGSNVLLDLNSSGHLTLTVAMGINPALVATFNSPPLDGNMHQIYATVNAGNTASTVYLDGASAGTGSGAGFTRGSPTVTAFGGEAVTSIGSTYFTQDFSGSFAYLAFYSADIGATRVLAHYNAGANAFSGERTDQRITRLLSYRANTGSVLDTGLGIMGTQDIQGRSLQDVLLEVGQVEAGAVFVDGQGRVNFRSRTRLLNPTPILTLDCNANGVDFASNFRDDTQSVINDATVTGSSGADQRFYNAASITADGEYSTSLQLPIQADTDALNMAGWIVGNGVVEQVTATPLVINLLQCSAAVALGVAQLQPLDCIQVTNCPTGAPASTMTFLVQGGTLSIAADAVTATLNTTPVPIAVGVWDSAHWDATSPTWSF